MSLAARTWQKYRHSLFVGLAQEELTASHLVPWWFLSYLCKQTDQLHSDNLSVFPSSELTRSFLNEYLGRCSFFNSSFIWLTEVVLWKVGIFPGTTTDRIRSPTLSPCRSALDPLMTAVTMGSGATALTGRKPNPDDLWRLRRILIFCGEALRFWVRSRFSKLLKSSSSFSSEDSVSSSAFSGESLKTGVSVFRDDPLEFWRASKRSSWKLLPNKTIFPYYGNFYEVD